jgi:large subunit ribosomal protein L29
MKPEKVRNLTAEELVSQERELSDQLFKLKFQLNMGQTESLKKIRGLRRDIARVKTIGRERELTASNGSKSATHSPTRSATQATKKTASKSGTEKK